MCLQGFDLLAKWESRQNSRACISNSTESEVEVLLKNLFSTFFYLHIQLHFYKQFIYEWDWIFAYIVHEPFRYEVKVERNGIISETSQKIGFLLILLCSHLNMYWISNSNRSWTRHWFPGCSSGWLWGGWFAWHGRGTKGLFCVQLMTMIFYPLWKI